MRTSAAFSGKRAAWRLAALATLAVSAAAPSFAGCSSPSRDMGSSSSQAVGSTGLIISAIYGGGGNSGATFKNDFVELFNRGSQDVTLSGLSLQYGSAAQDFASGSTNPPVPLPSVTVGPGRYFLVQLAGTVGADGGTVGGDLPTADFTSSAINLSATSGKIALASITMPLGCGGSQDGGVGRCPSTNIVDMVGYGTASDYEGPSGSAVGALANASGAARKGAGCTDTDVNKADFDVVNPMATPRNQATPAAPCSLPSDAGDDGAADASDGGAVVDAAPDVVDDGGSADDGSADGGSDDGGSNDGGGSDDGGSDDGGSAVDSGPIPPGDGDGLVISQFYGGGGNAGAPLNRKFVELFNRGSKPASMKGLSIQYGSFDHDFDAPLGDGGPGRNITLLPDTDVQPGHYVLVGMAFGTADAGAPLPTPDIDSTINPSATNGKIALTRISTSLGCGGTMRCPTTNIVDMVGYGTATDYEGSAAAPALDNTSALLRKGDGCSDGDMNNLDFDKKAPAPRNAATAVHTCSLGGNDAGQGGDDDAGSQGDDGGSLGNAGGGHTDGGTSHDGGAPPPEDTFGGGNGGGCAMETAETPGGPIALAFAALGFIAARRRRRA